MLHFFIRLLGFYNISSIFILFFLIHVYLFCEQTDMLYNLNKLSFFQISLQILINGIVYYQFTMGKRKNQTQPNIKTNFSGLIFKKKRLSTKLFSFSTSDAAKFNKDRSTKIMKNVRKALKKLQNLGASDNKKGLISALNLTSEKQIACSAMDIPSIQNMVLSKKQLYSYQDEDNSSQSGVSFNQSLEYCVIQNQPELMLSYMCLAEKALSNLGIVLSSKQIQKLLKGVWNLITKYWFDDFYNCQYQNLGTKIEWGLLELLNFDLKVQKKQRILMEAKIKSLSFMDS